LPRTARLARTNEADEDEDEDEADLADEVDGDLILTGIDKAVASRKGQRAVTFDARAHEGHESRNMTVEAPPSLLPDAQGSSERRPPPRRTRPGKRIAVLYNVDFEDACPEDDPMWASRADVAYVATSVATALASAGHDAHLVGLDGDLSGMRAKLLDLEPDCAFNLCESLVGDARLESAVPLVLELLGIPFTGSPPEVLGFALRKDRVKQRLEAAGIPTPAGCTLSRPGDPCDLPFPLIVKPVREDGSAGISRTSVVHGEAELRREVRLILSSFKQPALVEQYVDGREFNVAMLGHPTPRVLPLSEIDFTALPAGAPRIVSYEAKWATGSVDDLGTVPVLHPALPNAVAARVRRVATDAFRAVGVRDYGRVDVRLAANGTPHVVDVNPNCDLSPQAGMARAAAAVGIDYTALAGLLVRYALRRRTSLRRVPAAI
jgi:D-alanine-D-alanine ligase